jgi:predicted nicotinamide N-methyase
MDSMRPITLILYLLMPCVAIAQDDRLQPIRPYAEGLNIAKSDRRPLLVFVTQKVCQPCKLAKVLIEDMRYAKKLGDCVVVSIDATTPEGRAIMVGKKQTPQLVLFDLRQVDVDPKKPGLGIERIDEPTVLKLLATLTQKDSK